MNETESLPSRSLHSSERRKRSKYINQILLGIKCGRMLAEGDVEIEGGRQL